MSVPPRDILNPAPENTGATFELVGTVAAHGVFLTERKLPLPEFSNTMAPGVEGAGLVGSDPQNGVASVELRVTEPAELEAATNRVTNPSFENGTDGWAEEGTGTVERVIGDGVAGVCHARVTCAAGNDGIATSLTGGGYLTFQVRGDVAVKVVRGSTQLASIDVTDNWQQVDLEVPSATGSLKFVAAGAGTFDIDAVSVTDIETPYFDGDTPGCSWTGARHESSSTRPESGGPRFWAIIEDLQQLVQGIKRRGGTYLHIPPQGVPVTYDLVDARITALPSDRSTPLFRCEPTIEFECRPYGRLEPVVVATAIGETDFAVVPIPEVPGSVDALGRLKISEQDDSDRLFAWWGLRHRYLDGNPLEFDSGDVTLTGATVSDSVVTATLLSQERSLFTLEGQHRGTYRVWALAGGTDQAQITWMWGIDDGRLMARNPSVVLESSTRTVVDLGLMIVPEDATGWKAEFVGKTGTMTLSRIWLQPVAECAGLAKADMRRTSGGDVIRFDRFSGSGELNGASMGYSKAGARTWSSTNGRFSRSSGKLVPARNADNDQLAAASVTGGTPESFGLARVSVGVLCDLNGKLSKMGVYGRYASSHYVKATVIRGDETLSILTLTFTKTGASQVVPLSSGAGLFEQPGRVRVVLAFHSGGLAIAAAVDSVTNSILAIAGLQHSDLNTGGSNATGACGIVDQRFTSGTQDAAYYDFTIEDLVGSTDQLPIIGKDQAGTLTHREFIRQDDQGDRIGESAIEGDYLRIPPYGRELAPSELAVFVSRSLPGSGIEHSTADEMDLELTVIPRVLLT